MLTNDTILLPEDSADKMSMRLVNDFIDIFLTACYHSPEKILQLSNGWNHLTFSLIIILRTCRDSRTLRKVLHLLQIMIVIISERQYNGSDSGGASVDADTVGEEEMKESEERSLDYLRYLFYFKTAVEAVKRNDKGMCQCVICVYVPAL